MDFECVKSELKFKAVRSSGAGGQNVNKVSSKVVLSFDLNTSKGLTEKEKELLIVKLAKRLTGDNVIILNCEESRSQFKNKEIVSKRFFDLLKNALVITKIRKATKVPRSVIEKRIRAKRNQSELKSSRRKPDF
jgi:ribosome-associated protein